MLNFSKKVLERLDELAGENEELKLNMGLVEERLEKLAKENEELRENCITNVHGILHSVKTFHISINISFTIVIDFTPIS